MRFLLLILMAAFFMGAAPAFAAGGSCYTNAEAEAEQGIRIHSELMVIGLNCQAMRMRGGLPNLYAQYHQFTKKHEKVFVDYENRLMGYFSRTGAGNPEAKLNTMRTQFANKISLDAAQMRPDLFCNRYAERLIKVNGMDEKTLRKWASTIYASHPVSYPVCH